LEANADRDAQLRLKREIVERDRLADQHYHDLMLADVEARKRREELETIERNRANHLQVQALVEQIASLDSSKAARAERIAEEHKYLVLILQVINHLRSRRARSEQVGGENEQESVDKPIWVTRWFSGQPLCF